jgi:hypothetical protein
MFRTNSDKRSNVGLRPVTDHVRLIRSLSDVLSDIYTEYPTVFRDCWNSRR